MISIHFNMKCYFQFWFQWDDERTILRRRQFNMSEVIFSDSNYFIEAKDWELILAAIDS